MKKLFLALFLISISNSAHSNEIKFGHIMHMGDDYLPTSTSKKECRTAFVDGKIIDNRKHEFGNTLRIIYDDFVYYVDLSHNRFKCDYKKAILY